MIASITSHNPRRQNRRGFVVAPLLYMLGLIGVIGGVIYSNNMQSIRSVMTVQNSLTVRSDLQAAANTLSAEAVFSTDNQTLCTPRSVHQSSGNPCTTAPVALTQLGDLGTDPHMPANAVAAASSGVPVEVGIFPAGAGMKQLDPNGHYYIYCRWENPRSSPALPAFVILSAGQDGNLQTQCGDTTTKGDDALTIVTVGEAINRAALWQSDASNNVSYGATGSKVTIDSNGDLFAAGNITAAGSLNGQSASITNGITASSLTASGNVSGNNISGNTLEISGTATIGGAATLGTLSAQATTLDSLTVTHDTTIDGGLTIQGGDLVLANGYSYAQIDSTGNARRLIALSPTNDILLGGHNGTNNIYFLTGNSTVGFINLAGDLDMVGNIVGVNGMFGGDATAANVTASSTVTGVTGNFQNLTANNLTAGNTAITGTASITGVLTGSSANFSGTVSAAGFSSSAPVTLNGGAAISGGSLNAGDANLGATTVSSLTDTGFLTVSGVSNLNGGVFVSGGLTANSGASMNSYLNVNGPAILNNLVGIGTDNPQAPLDVYQPSGSYAFIRDDQSGFKLISGGGGNYIESAGAGMTGAAPLSIMDMNGAHTWQSFDTSGNVRFWNNFESDGDAEFYGGLGVPDADLVFWTSNYSGNWHTLYEDAPYAGGSILNIETGEWSGYVNFNVGSKIGTTTVAQIGCNPCGSDTALPGGNLLLFGTAPSYDTIPTNVDIEANAASYFNGGRVGIGTTTPAATLDVNGYTRLKKYSSAPATCSATNDGAIALTHIYTLCVCKSGTGWVTASTGTTACSF